MLHHRHTPPWVLAGALTLTAVAGCVNAVTVLNVFHSVTHMTGTLASISLELGRGHAGAAVKALGVVVCFLLGAAMSGVLIRQPTLDKGRRYGVALMLEGVVLVVAWVGLVRGSTWGQLLPAVACGLQNALATSYSGAVIRTTHMTGIVTDLGQAIGHWLAREPVDWSRVRLHLVLLVGFVLGGATGAFATPSLGPHAILMPAAIVFVAGASWTVLRHFAPDAPRD